MARKIIYVVLIGIIYLIYARFVLTPHLYKNFSLIDDGQSTKYGYYLRKCFVERSCSGFKTQVMDMESGRSRLGYWLVQGILYQGRGLNAQFQHEFRIYGFGLIIVILLVLACLAAGSNFVAILLAAAVLVANYSFSENIIRLGTVEPYQVVFMGLFSPIFLNQRALFKKRTLQGFLVSIIILIFCLVLKETSVVILPAILVLGLLFPETFNRKLTMALIIISGTVFLLAKYIFSGAGIGATYVSDYKVEIKFMFQNAKNIITLLFNSLSPFPKIIALLFILTFIFKRMRRDIFNHNLVYWFMTFALSTAVLFPWKYVLDRYLLISIFSFCVLLSIVITKVLKPLEKLPMFSGKRKMVLHFIVFLAVANLFFRGAPINIARTINYRNWFALFTQFEADQVREISKYKDATVHINAKNLMDNWEIIYEIPLHLEYFYDGKPEVIRLEEGPVPKSGYLFTRPSLTPVISLEDLQKSKYQLLESRSYSVLQIDPISFREMFKLRPVQALQNPPLLKEGFNYYWEIRKL